MVTPARLEQLFVMEPSRLVLEGIETQAHQGYVLERLHLALDTGEKVRGLLTRPGSPSPWAPHASS